MSPFRLYTDGICWRKIYIPMVYVGIKFIYRWYIGHIPMVYRPYTDSQPHGWFFIRRGVEDGPKRPFNYVVF